MIIKLCVWLASFRKPSLPPERSGEARVLARVGYACNANQLSVAQAQQVSQLFKHVLARHRNEPDGLHLAERAAVDYAAVIGRPRNSVLKRVA